MRWRHKKRGTEYEEVGRGYLQASDLALLADGAPMVVYKDADGVLHCRVEREFMDGRFEQVCDDAPVPGAGSWLISVPVWGAEYARTFVRVAAPALVAAAGELNSRGESVKFVIHTTPAEQAVVRAALLGCEVEVRLIVGGPTYVTLQKSHADAVVRAVPGTRIVLLNADLVVSRNLLTRCGEHFDAGKLAVVVLGIRTAADPLACPPAGSGSRDLLVWAWEHRHRIIKDLEWGSGGSMLPTNLFFSRAGSVVARGFHLHPVAIVKQPNTEFHSTIDGDLLDCFPREAIHVVTDPDDCSMLEVSPPDRRFPVREGLLTPERVVASMVTRASATHRWLFEHRIGVVGANQDCGDEQVANKILELLSNVPTAEVGGQRGRAPGGPRGSRPSRPNAGAST